MASVESISSLGTLTPSSRSSVSFTELNLRRRQRCPSCSENTSVEEEPEVIITRRQRTKSVSQQIVDEVEMGTVKYFCRSRGHGFITPDKKSETIHELFLHISDIEGEFVPRTGDRVQYRICPIPPRYDNFQAVHVHIIDFTEEVHYKWEIPETPEELEEEKSFPSLSYDI